MPTKRNPFTPSRAAETQFMRALRKVGRVAGHLVEAHVDGVRIKDEPGMKKALTDYAKVLGPWAESQAARMLKQVSKSNRKALYGKAREKAFEQSNAQSKEMGRLMREQVAETHVGRVANALMREQVELIKSIPERAGVRAQKLSIEAVYNGTRASEVAKALAETTKVSESDALRIARTEVARANASITQARAQAVGAVGYFWRTTMDGAERESHAKMNGKYVPYDKPPKLSDGTEGHAGTFPNCRCFQDVHFED